ncbi:hypothetical protein BGW38_010508, partial [Lunasporangiospora selenospora]
PAPIPVQVSTPLSGNLSDVSRPGTPVPDNLDSAIDKIRDKFFAPNGSIAKFLDSF